jgi:hypothetical protein
VCSLFFILESAATGFACTNYTIQALPIAAGSTLRTTEDCR